MTLEEAENTIKKMDRKHHIYKWIALALGVWLFSLPLLPETFPYIDWLRAKNPNTFYTVLGVFSFVWAIDNWRTTKELSMLKNTLKLAKQKA
jgi:hypothetical protein